MTRNELLNEALRIVTTDRHDAHGNAEENLQAIAVLWSAFLNAPSNIGLSEYLRNTIEPHDVAVMMILLKIARIKNNPNNKDNWIDIAGYAAIGGESHE